MKTRCPRELLVLCAMMFAAACGVRGRGDETRHDEREPPIATAREAVSTAPTASGVTSPAAAPIPMANFPLEKVCVHHKADGTCMLPTASDQDADGFPRRVDCNDHDPYIYPGAPEAKCDLVDDDCDGRDLCPVDGDGDGFSPPNDCDDNDASRHPNQPEIWCNGIDEDCDGKDDCDHDGDRIPQSEDCNDNDPSISPVTPEILCDGIDQNCDSTDCCNNDQDGDGVTCASDCDDHDPKTYPGAPVSLGCYFKDVNCDGKLDGICRR